MSSWQISERVAFVTSGQGRVVILHLDQPGDQPLALLGTGAAIWAELTGDDETDRPVVDEQDLTDRLAARYDTTPGAIAPELSSFLAGLADSGHLIRDPG